MGVDDEVSDSEVLVAEAFSDDDTSASRHAPARRPAIRNIIQESDSESERDEDGASKDMASEGVASEDVASEGVANEDVASEGTTEGWVGETGVDFEGARGLQTQSDSYDKTETGKSCQCHCIVLHSPFMQSLPLRRSIVLPTMQICLTRTTRLFQPLSYKGSGCLQTSQKSSTMMGMGMKLTDLLWISIYPPPLQIPT